MVYKITYIDRKSFAEKRVTLARWYSEISVITNSGLEEGYDVLIEVEEDDE